MYFPSLPRLLNVQRRVSMVQANIVKYSSFSTSKRSNETDNLVLYGDEVSPLVRFVLMSASVLDVELKFNKVDLFLGEQMSESYKKINFLQKVPSLAVNDVVIKESHAIALFLCDQSDKGRLLYPEEPIKRALVNQFLFFNSNTLFQFDSATFTDFFAGKWPLDPKKIELWCHLLDFLENNLAENDWLTGNKMTLCDLGCAATISSMQLLIPVSNRHTKIINWMKRLQDLPCFEINKRGLERLNSFVKPSKQNYLIIKTSN